MKKLYSAVLSVLLVASLPNLAVSEELTPQICKEKAQAAAKLLVSDGEKALETIKDPNSSFRFANGEGYVWVHNLAGKMVMHPIKPALDGKGLLDMRDVNGVYLFVAMNELVQEKGEGWVSYAWPKPGEEKSSPKVSYVVLAKNGDQSYVAGSGMYDVTREDIKAKFPGDAIYED